MFLDTRKNKDINITYQCTFKYEYRQSKATKSVQIRFIICSEKSLELGGCKQIITDQNFDVVYGRQRALSCTYMQQSEARLSCNKYFFTFLVKELRDGSNLIFWGREFQNFTPVQKMILKLRMHTRATLNYIPCQMYVAYVIHVTLYIRIP